MKRAIILLLMFFTLCCWSEDKEKEVGYYVITTKTVRMRRTPNIKGRSVQNVPKDKRFLVLDEVGDYCEVEGYAMYFDQDGEPCLSKKLKGWVLMSKLKLEGGGIWTVQGPGVTIRTKPYRKGEILGIFTPDTNVKLIWIYPTWYKVKYRNKEGWIPMVSVKDTQHKYQYANDENMTK